MSFDIPAAREPVEETRLLLDGPVASAIADHKSEAAENLRGICAFLFHTRPTSP